MSRFVRRSDVVWRRVGDEVLVRTLDGRMATLRGTGAALWEELRSPVSVAMLTSRFAAEYEGSVELIVSDVQAALTALVAGDLVERR